ncbi:unnamed protein product, partial [Prorocentrum cordatum]
RRAGSAGRPSRSRWRGSRHRGAGRGAPPAAAAARGRRRAVAERGRGDRLVPAPAAAGGPPGGGDGERLVGRQPQPIARTGDPDGLTMQARAGSEGGPRAVTGRTASSASLTCLAAARPWWPAGRRHSMKMTHSSIGTSSRASGPRHASLRRRPGRAAQAVWRFVRTGVVPILAWTSAPAELPGLPAPLAWPPEALAAVAAGRAAAARTSAA